MYYAALANAALWCDYKVYRNKLTTLLRERKKHYYLELIGRHKDNSRAVGQTIHSYMGRSCLDRANLCISAGDLNNYFVELGLNAVKDLPPSRNLFSIFNIVLMSHFSLLL